MSMGETVNIVIPMPDTGPMTIAFPSRLTREQWDYFMNVIKIMEPGLVVPPPIVTVSLGTLSNSDPLALSQGTMEYLRVQCPNCHAKANEWCNIVDKYGIIARPTFQICQQRIDLSMEPM